MVRKEMTQHRGFPILNPEWKKIPPFTGLSLIQRTIMQQATGLCETHGSLEQHFVRMPPHGVPAEECTEPRVRERDILGELPLERLPTLQLLVLYGTDRLLLCLAKRERA